MYKILVIEDDESIRRLLQYDLKQLNYNVETADTGVLGLKLAIKNDYDVLVVDWMLPKVSGIEIIKAYREHNLKGVVIMLTAKSNEEDLLEAFQAGVDDYITKPFSPRELGARIAAHLRRFEYNEKQREWKFGNLTADLDMHAVYVNDKRLDLTNKEFDLLMYLLKNFEEFLSRDQILKEIWNFDYDGDTRIVDVHIFKLRSKIEDASILIESLRGVGYAAKTK